MANTVIHPVLNKFNQRSHVSSILVYVFGLMWNTALTTLDYNSYTSLL